MRTLWLSIGLLLMRMVWFFWSFDIPICDWCLLLRRMYFDSVLRTSIFKFFVKYSLILILTNILTSLPTASAIAGFVMIFSNPSFFAWFIPLMYWLILHLV